MHEEQGDAVEAAAGPESSPSRAMASSDARIVFTPSGLNGAVPTGTTVLEAARELGVDLDSVCGGRGICGRCQVGISPGSHSKWAITVDETSASEPGVLESDYRGKRPIADGNRLGCGVQVLGDLVVDVPPESQIHRQVVRKDIDLGDLVVDPTISLHYLDLEPQNAAEQTLQEQLDDGDSLAGRVVDGLAEQWDIADAIVPFPVLARLHSAFPRLTVAVRRHSDNDNTAAAPTVVAVWPGFVDRAVGAAVDIGSTTVAGHLCDLQTGEVLASAGRMNPQIRFGEDLMSRVSYVMMNPGGDRQLTDAIRGALQELLDELLDQAELDYSALLDVVLVGNPIMGHLVLGIDPTPLGQAPFPLATDRAVTATATQFDLREGPQVYFGPCIAGHVGADTAAAILAEKPHRSDKVQLLVDVGTNAEIVLGNSSGLLAASSPTGPAFEGAQISAGQRATAGAIERVRIDRATLEPSFRIIGCPHWSDTAEFAAEAPTVTGICGSGIIEVISELFLSGVIDAQGVIQGGLVERTSRVEPKDRTFSYRLYDNVAITQDDVRAIQLAKAALRAGVDLLLEHSPYDTVDEVRLAGAFGAHIDPTHAMVLGLIPDCPVDAVTSVGNAAGSGATMALLSATERSEMEQVVASVTKIETATEPRFQELFVAALAFPHENAPNPNLSQVVTLPPRPEPGTDQRRRRRRSRSAGGRAN